ncbi:NAD-dependent epimerase/dehydratase family protein [Polynucleobacter sp. JS-Mosq-20-D10]|uniref:NAD-dependent epimerase/dehydratase family protein n=1 Tax=Polynucleobacter sp. JS-Mosq-20-D10 TaxID=2576922 RepID=UPI001BFDD9D3|nr:NAD-dependent epimerase/dehydratase family protein [Polynucleobacter sp. JS-Mosq-20-D10]QWE00792.1 NAD-dependent epimerase/dehydratase family protein [Polynucleobacter sp. JS-Mosq-20-D10]
MQVREPIEGKKVLVVGGAGFIGSHLVDRLINSRTQEVVVVDNLFTGDINNLHSALKNDHTFLYRDDAEISTSLGYIFDNHEIDVVFNCATKALNYSYLNPANAFATNVNVVLNLLENQRRGRFNTLCHFSTSEVYGTAVYEPMDEEHPKNPTTAYAAGKAAADHAVESYVKMFNLDSYIVRPFNNFGPRQNYRGYLAGIIPITIWRILNGIAPEIHGSGLQSRDFIYVYDTVDAVLKLHAHLPMGESVNISTENQVSVQNLIKIICKKMNYFGEIVNKSERVSDVMCHVANNHKICELVEFNLTPFDDALDKTIEWYLNNISIDNQIRN